MTYGQHPFQDVPGRPFGRVWWCHAPWAHPFWHSYLFSLVDLTTPTARPPRIYLPGATHEVMVVALDPAFPNTAMPPHTLSPPNHGYQFIADSNEAAERRIVELLDMIDDHRLSPDTDHRRVWDSLFADGRSLVVGSLVTHPAPAGLQ